MSGEESYTLKEQIKNLDNLMTTFQTHIGLYSKNNTNIEQYLSYNRDQIEALQPEQCATISAEISLYCVHLHFVINKYKARLNWLESEFKRVTSSLINEYGVDKYNWRQVELKMLGENSYLQKLKEYEIDYTVKLTSIDGLNFALKNFIDSIKGIKYVKFNAEKNNSFI